jgi:hypothetical protein
VVQLSWFGRVEDIVALVQLGCRNSLQAENNIVAIIDCRRKGLEAQADEVYISVWLSLR